MIKKSKMHWVILLLVSAISIAQSRKQDTTKIATVGVFDGKMYQGQPGQKTYRINDYFIPVSECSRYKTDTLIGRKVRVEGILKRVNGKTKVTIKQDGSNIYEPSWMDYIENPVFTIK